MNNYERIMQGGIDSIIGILIDGCEHVCTESKRCGDPSGKGCEYGLRKWLESEREDTIELLKSDICAHYDIGCKPSDGNCEGCEVQGWLDRASKLFGVSEERKEQARKLADKLFNINNCNLPQCQYFDRAHINDCSICDRRDKPKSCRGEMLRDISIQVREIAGIE